MNVSSTPLMSLSAIGLDIEATSLDAKTARVVELAALHINGLEINSRRVFQQLVNPNEPIPKSASDIHGLTDQDVRGAPDFSGMTEALDQFIGSRVVIGHNIGYDLAVIDHEYARLNRAWKIPPFLDVRALARLAAPNLAGYSLETLCDWLGVEIVRRHRAFHDALAAIQIFVKLVPMLRASGVRTLAEAEVASGTLAGEEQMHRVAGWISPVRAVAANATPALAAVDGYPFRHRVRDAIRSKLVALDSSTAVGDAVKAALEPSSGGAVLVRSAGAADRILDTYDFLEATAQQPEMRAQTLGELGGRALFRVADEDFLYRALARISRHGVERLGVENRRGEIIGILSTADLLAHRTTAALTFGDEIETATSVPDLGRAWGRLPSAAASLLYEGLDPSDISAIIAAEICAITARAASLAEEQMQAAGKGDAPVPYAVLVLGSAGRGDSLLNADQDNAYVYASGDPQGPEDSWFAEAGTHMADILHEVGIPYCSGGVMAKNDACRRSFASWKREVTSWIESAEPVGALSSDIFFDGVPVYGELMLASDLMDFAFARARKSSLFLGVLGGFARDWKPPITMFGRLRADNDGRLDLKRNGLLPMFTLARMLAIKHGIRVRSTIGRLSELDARSLADPDLIEPAIAAYRFMMRLVLMQQIDDAAKGVPLSSRVDIQRMSRRERSILVDSIGATDGLVLAARE